jgi:hypothetical protein
MGPEEISRIIGNLAMEIRQRKLTQLFACHIPIIQAQAHKIELAHSPLQPVTQMSN